MQSLFPFLEAICTGAQLSWFEIFKLGLYCIKMSATIAHLEGHLLKLAKSICKAE